MYIYKYIIYVNICICIYIYDSSTTILECEYSRTPLIETHSSYQLASLVAKHRYCPYITCTKIRPNVQAHLTTSSDALLLSVSVVVIFYCISTLQYNGNIKYCLLY